MRALLASVFGVGLLLGAQLVFAQTSGGIDPVQYIVSPETPGPNQSVTIEAQGVGAFLGDATITWQLDGKTMSSSVGQRTFTFTTGPLGSVNRVHVEIDSSTQGTLTHDFTFVPSNVNLIWEAHTTTPFTYRGKALYSPGSTIKVVAFPTIVSGGTTISANNLSFEWQRNGTPVPAQSGKGFSTFTFSGDQLRGGEDVSVDVYFSGVKVGSAAVSIPAVEPELVFYNKDDLRGVLFDQALPSTVSLTGKEVTLQAVPYYFSSDSAQNGNLTFNWILDGQPTTGPDTANGILTLRQTGEGNGSATVSATMQNSDQSKFIQSATAALQINFGQTSSSNSLFGL
jgi:hypothetical protein